MRVATSRTSGQGVPVAASPDDSRRPETRPDLNRREHPRRPRLPPGERPDLVGLQLCGDEAGGPAVAKVATPGGSPLEPAGDGVPGQPFDPGNRRQTDPLDAQRDDTVERRSAMLEEVIGRAFRRRERLSAPDAGDVPLAVEILRRRLPPGRVIRPVGQPGATPPERSRHEEAVSHSRWPSPTEVLAATAPPVGRHPRGHAGRAPAAGHRLGLEGTRGDVGRGSGCRLWSPVCAPARARCVSGRAFDEPGRTGRPQGRDPTTAGPARRPETGPAHGPGVRGRGPAQPAASSNRCSSALRRASMSAVWNRWVRTCAPEGMPTFPT